MRVDGTTFRGHLQALDASAAGDPYFDPGYLALHEGTPTFFVAGPLAVSGMRLTIDGTDGLADLQSPNGYGGPVVRPGATRADLDEAWRVITGAAREMGIIALFHRLHPVLGNEIHLPPDAEVRVDRPTVYVGLEDGIEGALAGAHPRHRNKVARAEKHGLRVRWDEPEDWDRFASIYAASMDRLNAVASLRFDAAYFAALRALPFVGLAAAYEGDVMTAGHVFLFGTEHAHYHLGARITAASDWTTASLMHAGLVRAHERGLRGMHLGGGATTAPDDGVLRWKRSFGGRELVYRVGLVVSDPLRLRQLTEAWASRWGRAPSWLLPHRQPPPKETS